MAQAVVFEANFPGRLRGAEVDGRDARRSGVDGFTWTDGGIEGTAHQLFDNIAKVVDPAKIDIVISNHTEMDHSGSLPRVMHFAELDSDKWRQYAERARWPMSCCWRHRFLWPLSRKPCT